MVRLIGMRSKPHEPKKKVDRATFQRECLAIVRVMLLARFECIGLGSQCLLEGNSSLAGTETISMFSITDQGCQQIFPIGSPQRIYWNLFRSLAQGERG